MQFKKLILVAALGGLSACSDQDPNQAQTDVVEKPPLLESVREKSSAIAEAVEEKTQAAAESVQSSLEAAGESVSDTAQAAMDKGAELVDAAADTSRDAADSALEGSKQLVDKTQALAKDATARVAAAVPAGDDATQGDVAQLALGKRIYSSSCMACHAAGVAGAPKLGDVALWAPRIAQGVDTLNDHALNGYQGKSGYMPAKGGFSALSDDEVKAAVAYMVSASE